MMNANSKFKIQIQNKKDDPARIPVKCSGQQWR